MGTPRTTARKTAKAKKEEPVVLPPVKKILTPEVKLDALYAEIDGDLKFTVLKYRRRMVRGHGPTRNPSAMLIVEMPENNDENVGVPLTGPGGIVLHDLLTVVDLKRASHVYVTCVSKWRTHRELTKMELSAALPYLQREIAIIDPKVLITAGRFVNKLFFPKKDYNVIRNDVLGWKGRPVIPSLHPIAAARDPHDSRQELLKTFKILGELV